MAVKIQTIDSKCETENLQPHSKTKDKLSQVPRAQILTLPIWLLLILTTVQAMILALDKDKVVEPKLAFVVYESPAANESVLENYRRLTYMLAHDGWSHFLGNVILQLVTGLIISYRIGLGGVHSHLLDVDGFRVDRLRSLHLHRLSPSITEAWSCWCFVSHCRALLCWCLRCCGKKDRAQ